MNLRTFKFKAMTKHVNQEKLVWKTFLLLSRNLSTASLWKLRNGIEIANVFKVKEVYHLCSFNVLMYEKKSG